MWWRVGQFFCEILWMAEELWALLSLLGVGVAFGRRSRSLLPLVFWIIHNAW
jgi:hypothetical protein